MSELWYSELKTQDYLLSNKFTTTQAKTVYSFRTRMANFTENFRGVKGNLLCSLCGTHLDSQVMAFNCPKLKIDISIRGRYEDLFMEDIPTEVVQTIMDIMSYRKNSANA